MQLGLGFRQNIQSPTYDIKGCWSFGLDLVLHDEYPIGTAEIAHEVSVEVKLREGVLIFIDIKLYNLFQ